MSFVCPEGGRAGTLNIEKFNRKSVTTTLLVAEPFFEAR